MSILHPATQYAATNLQHTCNTQQTMQRRLTVCVCSARCFSPATHLQHSCNTLQAMQQCLTIWIYTTPCNTTATQFDTPTTHLQHTTGYLAAPNDPCLFYTLHHTCNALQHTCTTQQAMRQRLTICAYSTSAASISGIYPTGRNSQKSPKSAL